MNLNNNPTMDQLRDLLRVCDDRAGRHVMWVDRTGEVWITLIPGDVTDFVTSRSDLQMWFRVFVPGQDYVGPSAADDIGWVEDLFFALTREWPKARGHTKAMVVEDW